MAETIAGHDLDALIAENFLGLDYESVDGTWRYEGLLIHLGEELPAFSTSIADAWRLVEEMAIRGWKVDVQNRFAGCWACHVHFDAPNYAKVFETADSAPLAICKASLAATRVAAPPVEVAPPEEPR